MATKYLTPILALLLAGCAIDQTERYHNQTAQVETREAFERQKARCEHLGGAMVIGARGSRIPTNRHTETDYQQAGCYTR